MLGEVVVLAVFQTEDAIGQQQLVLEDEVGQGGDLLQRIGWVGKDEVELLVARLEKAEHVATDAKGIGIFLLAFELVQTLLNEAVVVAIELHTDYLPAAS